MNTAEKLFDTLDLDENGLLVDASSWDKQVAEVIAEQLGVGKLSPDHWKVIGALRKHYNRFGVAPAMFNICRSNGQKSDWVHNLFNTCLDAWRVAGLPDPGEEAKSYLSDM